MKGLWIYIMSNNNVISVIIPVYNGEKTIVRALKSLEIQKYKDIEIICVDDGSTDNSYEIMKNYKNNSGLEVKIFQQLNQGASAARNLGIEKSKGEYLMFLDADDEYEEGLIDYMYFLVKNIDLVMCGIKKVENGKYVVNNKIEDITIQGHQNIANNFMTLQLMGVINSPCNKLYRKRIITANNIKFDLDQSIGEDFLFNLKYISCCWSLKITSKKFLLYNTDDSFVTKQIRENEYENRKKNVEKLQEFYDNNNIESDLSFQYVKLLYSDIYQILKNSKRKSVKKINDRISEIRLDDKIIKTEKEYKPKHLIEKILVYPLKLRTNIIVIIVSYISYFFSNNRKFKKKIISI
ncbi:glycosyltransferase family 2 protein [Vagococcus fluvialis]|uniref:glycosyltransferase family 2 protein n=1 Tax=Vagococcus fluvialis TaxID=2738 RepID=UPI0022E85563|nr:glycosyltransferase family 2 protein [Vagococcus fluvialis]